MDKRFQFKNINVNFEFYSNTIFLNLIIFEEYCLPPEWKITKRIILRYWKITIALDTKGNV